MYFGGTPFAASPFGDPGFNPNAFVNVTGSRINESTGSVTLVGKANFAVTGSRLNFSIGNIFKCSIYHCSLPNKDLYHRVLTYSPQYSCQ